MASGHSPFRLKTTAIHRYVQENKEWMRLKQRGAILQEKRIQIKNSPNLVIKTSDIRKNNIFVLEKTMAFIFRFDPITSQFLDDFRKFNYLKKWVPHSNT